MEQGYVFVGGIAGLPLSLMVPMTSLKMLNDPALAMAQYSKVTDGTLDSV